MRWLRAELLWWRWWVWNFVGTSPAQSLMTCIHPIPPGFSKCKFKVTYCLTCGQGFKC